MNTDNLNLPWSSGGKGRVCQGHGSYGTTRKILDKKGNEIAEFSTYFEEGDIERRDYTIEAVNSHTQLVERVKELEGHLAELMAFILSDEDMADVIETAKQARKALQKKEKE